MTGCNNQSKTAQLSLTKNLLHPGTSISGPSQVCSSGATYTVVDLPPVDSIIWSCGSNLAISSGQNTGSCTFIPTGSGTSSISVRLVTDCGDITLPQKSVWAGLTASFTGNTTILAGGSGTYTGTASCGYSPYQYRWWLRKEGTGEGAYLVATGNPLVLTSVPHTSQTLSQEASSSDPIIMQPYQRTYFNLYMVAIDNNGNTYTTSEKQITAYGNVDLIAFSPYAMAANSTILNILPNPTNGQTTIELSSEDVQVENVSNEWDLEVYDQGQQLKAKKTKIKGKSTTLNTSGWKEGVYVVRAEYNGQILTEKLVVKKP
ncbi:MAG TPA: T9SS type A sorting domain-containing protein [Sunxiuqinia sp.]|nr:T9SS type A sorting domain-containing protein [Sunxiuqinia sp.]